MALCLRVEVLRKLNLSKTKTQKMNKSCDKNEKKLREAKLSKRMEHFKRCERQRMNS